MDSVKLWCAKCNDFVEYPAWKDSGGALHAQQESIEAHRRVVHGE